MSNSAPNLGLASGAGTWRDRHFGREFTVDALRCGACGGSERRTLAAGQVTAPRARLAQMNRSEDRTVQTVCVMPTTTHNVGIVKGCFFPQRADAEAALDGMRNKSGFAAALFGPSGEQLHHYGRPGRCIEAHNSDASDCAAQLI